MLKTKAVLGLMVLLAVSIGAQAGVIFDMGWDLDQTGRQTNSELTIDTTGTVGVDAYDGWFSGNENTVTVVDGATANSPSGTNVVDFTTDIVNPAKNMGAVVLRDARVYGDLIDLYGGRTAESPDTPSPYMQIGATDEWTIEAMFSCTNDGSRGAIIANNGSSGLPEWWIRVRGDTDGAIQSYFEDGDGAVISAEHGSGYNDGEWYHLAVVFDRDDTTPTTVTVTNYINGVPLGSVTVENMDAVGDGTRDIEIGEFDGTGAVHFEGMMDRVAISNETLAPGSFVIPEPATLILLGLGSIATLRRKR